VLVKNRDDHTDFHVLSELPQYRWIRYCAITQPDI